MSGTNQSSSSSRDPYTILGLDHNASPTQIKVAYRKLALQYHPDRQQQQQEQSEQQQQEATDKFAEISTAYAILSDPSKKSQYDHLYKFGAFDDGSDPISEMRDDANDSGCYSTSYRNHATSSSGYKYTENLSGGYYTNKATSTSNNNNTSSSSTAPSPPPFFSFVELRKQDSFFDELLHSPKNKTSSSSSPFQNNSEQHQQQHDQQPRTNDTNNGAQQQQQQQKQQPKQHPKRSGIGFSIRPMGKHLSIHVPSKAEIMTSMASGEPLPLFGTRVTFSTSESLQKRRTLISTTTRIAHGQQRTVKRTVYIQPDGKKEEIIEENGVVKRRHVEELCPPHQPPPSPSSAAVGGKGKGKEAQQTQQQRKGLQEKQAASSCTGWHSGVICGLRDCVLGPCLGV